MSHARLEWLPSELLSAIFTLVCSHCTPEDMSDGDSWVPGSNIRRSWHKTLASLCRTSKTLHAIATPILYHVFISRTPEGTLGFIRTIHARKDLATKVKHAYFLHKLAPWFLEDDVDHLIQELGPSAPLWNNRVQISTREGTQLGWDHGHEARAFGQRFMVGIVLSLATNLEFIEVMPPGDGWHELNSLWPARIPELKTLHLWSEERQESGFPLVDATPLLRSAPNLRHISVRQCGSTPPGVDLGNLVTLELENSWFLEKDAINLFASLSNLQSLRISHWNDLSLYVQFPNLTLPQLFGAMHPTRRTLRYLELEWIDTPFDINDDTIPCLEPFSVLETLVIPANCVYTDWPEDMPATPSGSLLAAVLPKSIRSLALIFLRKEAYEDVLEFARESQRGAFPNLRDFGIFWHDAAYEGMMLGLEEVFEDVEVRAFGDSRAFSEAKKLLRQPFRVPFAL